MSDRTKKAARDTLTRMERSFVANYLDCFDVARAARLAGVVAPGDTEREQHAHHARVGRRIMRRYHVSNAVALGVTSALVGRGVEKGKVLAELCSLAFFDPQGLFAPDGSPLPMADIDPQTRACISGIEVQETYTGSGQDRVFDGYIRKYKIIPKTEALKLLGTHLQIFEPEEDTRKRDRLDELVDALKAINSDGEAEPQKKESSLIEGEGRVKE